MRYYKYYYPGYLFDCNLYDMLQPTLYRGWPQWEYCWRPCGFTLTKTHDEFFEFPVLLRYASSSWWEFPWDFGNCVFERTPDSTNKYSTYTEIIWLSSYCFTQPYLGLPSTSAVIDCRLPCLRQSRISGLLLNPERHNSCLTMSKTISGNSFETMCLRSERTLLSSVFLTIFDKRGRLLKDT